MRIVTVLLVLAAATFSGCDSGSEGTGGQGGNLALLQGCALDRTLDLFAALSGLENLLLAAQDPASALALGVVVGPGGPTDPPNTFTYHVPIDLDGDGQRDDAIDGKITFSKNPLLGFVPGDTASLSWMLVGDDAQGSGDLDLLLTPSATVEITGNGTILTGGCTLDFEIDPAHPVAVALPAELALTIGTLEVSGWIHLEVVAGEDTLNGTLKMEAASQVATVEDVQVNGAAASSFTLAVGGGPCEPPVAGLEAWVGRWRVDYDCVGTDGPFSGTFWMEISLAGNGVHLREFEDGAFLIESDRSPFDGVAVGGNPHRITYTDDNAAFAEDITFALDPACGNSFSKTSAYENKPPNPPTSGTCTGTGSRIGP
jgi:hypothetical protein